MHQDGLRNQKIILSVEAQDKKTALEHNKVLNSQLGYTNDEQKRAELEAQKQQAKGGLREIRRDQVTRKQAEQVEQLDMDATQIKQAQYGDHGIGTVVD